MVLFKKQVDNLKTNHRVCAIQRALWSGAMRHDYTCTEMSNETNVDTQ